MRQRFDPQPSGESDHAALSLPIQHGQQQLAAVLQSLFAPIAQLCLAHGASIQLVEECLRLAFVREAELRLSGGQAEPGNRIVSRLSASTGLTRREVTRLRALMAQPHPQPARGSHATQVFARWISDPQYLNKGKPKRLPRTGAAPSFESLAQTITQDVHPRTLLEELCQLGLASLDETRDQVELKREAFVPRGDRQQMLNFLAENVGDHLRAATSNVVEPQPVHLEQAIFGEGLSQTSIDYAYTLMREEWSQLQQRMVPQLQHLVETDLAEGRQADQRLRIGLYTYSAAQSSPPVEPGTP
jgi:hypothetical protein